MLTKDELGRIKAQNRQPSDDLDRYLTAVSEADTARAAYYADCLRRQGASDKFLALCVKLVFLGVVVVVVMATFTPDILEEIIHGLL